MAIFKVKVIQEKIWKEYNEGTAYIKAGSLKQAQRRAKKINLSIRYSDYNDAEFIHVDFDEGETVLIDINDFTNGKEDFTTNAREINELANPVDNIDYELSLDNIEEVKDIDESKISILYVPE